MSLRADTRRLALVPAGPLGRLALRLIRALPPDAGRSLARLCWRLGLLREEG